MTLDRNDDFRLAEEDAAQADLEVQAVDADDLDPEEVEVAEIRADIEETRIEMGGTLQELGDRLDPGNLVNQAKENVRDATIGRVEETAKGMSDMVMETIKRNPIPAAMAGAGLALLWKNRSGGSTGSSNGGSRYSAMYGTTSSYDQYGGQYSGGQYSGGQYSGGQYDQYSGQQGGQGVTSKVGDAASTVGDNVTGAVGQVGNTVGQGVQTVGSTVGQGVQTVGSTVGQGVQEASWRLERVMQSSPLAMTAIALGAGAVAGALVPETPQEQRVLGDASRTIGETVRDTVSQATDKAEEQLDQIEQETSSSRS